MSLHQAFVYVQSLRPCIQPNMGFFRQLIAYEKKLNGGIASVQMKLFTTNDNRHAIVPDFYPKQFPNLFMIQLNRQQSFDDNNCNNNDNRNT